MNAKRYRQIRQLFDAVLEQPETQRSAYLAQAGDGDASLREEVRRLLDASDNRTEIFEQPPVVREGPGPLERWEGRRLGPYQILRELGEGGMGIVYLARRADGAFQKEVAIKIVRRQLATPQFFERFQRERDILARLEHPHIARLLDGGTTPPFLVMEYVQGEPLLNYADSRRLSYDARLALLRQVAAAVDYAHRQGVIHRDLKPGNIFVTADGEVKLLDFGIAAWQQAGAESELSPTLAMSPAYASPEQIRGDKTNSATDIYSLGLVSYELLAGMPPFRLDEMALDEILRKVVEETPAPPSIAVRQSKHPTPAELSKLRQMAPIQLLNRLEDADGTLLRALSKHREDRPASAGALVNELDQSSVRHKSIPRWVETLVQQWDLAAFHATVIGLILAGAVHLNPTAWLAYLWGSAFAFLRRFGFLQRMYALSSTFTIAAGLYTLAFGAGLASGSRQELAHRITVGTIAVLAFVAFDLLRYYLRRKSSLGQLLFAPKGINRGREQAVLLGAALLWFLYELFQGHSDRLLSRAMIAMGIWISWKLSFKPLEIREKGLVAPAALLPWSSIERYSWHTNTQLELRMHSPVLGVPIYQRVTVHPEDHDAVQAILENWLLQAN